MRERFLNSRAYRAHAGAEPGHIRSPKTLLEVENKYLRSAMAGEWKTPWQKKVGTTDLQEIGLAEALFFNLLI